MSKQITTKQLHRIRELNREGRNDKEIAAEIGISDRQVFWCCLLYTSDAADEL